MSNNKPSSASIVDSCTKRLQALKSYVQNTNVTIAINGLPYQGADVIAIFQECLDTRAKLNTQRAEVKAALTARAAAETKRRMADRALKPWVINQFGAESTEAHAFGFPPPKVPARTAEEKAHAVALAKATRKARRTMGRKQRLDIKGTIEVPTAPAAPAVTVQAAPPAAGTQTSDAAPPNGAALQVNGISH